MRTEYCVWIKNGWEARGHFRTLDAKGIVEHLFPLENVDDIEGMVTLLERVVSRVESSRDDYEEEDGRIAVPAIGGYASYDCDTIYEAEQFADDIIGELEGYIEMIKEEFMDEE